MHLLLTDSRAGSLMVFADSHFHPKMSGNISLGGTSPKITRVRHWGDVSPLAAKRRRLDDAVSASTEVNCEVSARETALDGCIRMTPTDFDIGMDSDTQRLAPELEPPLLEPPLFTFPVEPTTNQPFTMRWSSDGLGTRPSGTQLSPASISEEGAEKDHPQIPVSSAPLLLTLPSLPGCSGPPLLSEGLQASLDALDARSHSVRLAKVQLEQSDKSTSVTYGRHINRYEKWWSMDQVEYVKLHPGWTRIPAFPITPAKACVFLEHESTREKVCFPPF